VPARKNAAVHGERTTPVHDFQQNPTTVFDRLFHGEVPFAGRTPDASCQARPLGGPRPFPVPTSEQNQVRFHLQSGAPGSRSHQWIETRKPPLSALSISFDAVLRQSSRTRHSVPAGSPAPVRGIRRRQEIIVIQRPAPPTRFPGLPLLFVRLRDHLRELTELLAERAAQHVRLLTFRASLPANKLARFSTKPTSGGRRRQRRQ
jgi:hypothetical protein